MTTASTIPSSLPSLAVHRPASLNSLSDSSDNLALGSRPCSASSTLLIIPGNFDIWGQNTTDHITDSCTYRHHSNISVSFLGSRIKRQYRSSFMLSGDRMIGVTRCETFQPEDAKADIRVNLSLQGPLNMSMVSHSDPGLFPRSPEDNRDWARLMLTTDQPRDSELLGRIGTRNYFSNKESGAPYFHRRIKPIQKEEEYVFKLNLPNEESQSQTVNDAAEGVIEPRSFTVLVTGTGSDVEPSTERVEKDTYPLLSRHHWRPSSAVSAPGRISLSEKELNSPISDSRSPFTQQISDHLPSTERSESIIHLKRTKSETSLSAQSLTSIFTPSLELLHPESAAAPHLRTVKSASEVRVGEQSTSLVDSTLSLHTDFEEEEKAAKCTRGAVRREMDGEASRVVSSIIPHATVSKACIFAENTFASSSPFDSSTNGIVARFGGVGAQECSYIHHGQIPVKSTVLHTSLQLNRIVTPETGPKSNLLFPEKMQEGPIGVESNKDVEVLQGIESTEQTPITPLPRKRKRAFQQDGEVEDGMCRCTVCTLHVAVAYCLLVQYQ
ncbi:unnamed protein product [Hydatigera taeniaeformis]|uniref:Protein kinase domain-containing protein n=1 Tax=Hydatigena taeniaeformis TaxID=6205 RepID=A0A0R3WT67_HYDTA|nr:unnamed protein product [Hydatigera taeniaeformis]